MGLPWQSSVRTQHFHCQGPWVRFLVWKLGSRRKKRKRKKKRWNRNVAQNMSWNPRGGTVKAEFELILKGWIKFWEQIQGRRENSRWIEHYQKDLGYRSPLLWLSFRCPHLLHQPSVCDVTISLVQQFVLLMYTVTTFSVMFHPHFPSG